MTKQISLDSVQNVYTGKANSCCCGCSGKHSYPTKHKDNGIAIRGYAISPDDISDLAVKRAVNKINKAMAKDPNSVTWDHDKLVWMLNDAGTRMTIVYLD